MGPQADVTTHYLSLLLSLCMPVSVARMQLGSSVFSLRMWLQAMHESTGKPSSGRPEEMELVILLSITVAEPDGRD
jgi:hypothetical protein